MSHTFVSGGSLVMAKTVKELLEGKLWEIDEGLMINSNKMREIEWKK